ncbi:MAG: hypothetical protein JW942_10365 [Opitutales bacterium]|nr:hypothetical protein [Opitutales bacterium]
MSLINDALKKAQANSQTAAASSNDGSAPNSMQRRATPPPSQSLAQWMAIIGILALVFTVASWGRADKDGSNKDEQAAKKLASDATESPAAQTPEAAAPAQQAPTGPITRTKEAIAASEELNADLDDVLGKEGVPAQPEASQQTVAAAIEQAPAPVVEKPQAPMPDDSIARFVDSIQVRGAGRGKVLLLVPGQTEATAFTPGMLVDATREVYLAEIGKGRLVFKDARGVPYAKAMQ